MTTPVDIRALITWLYQQRTMIVFSIDGTTTRVDPHEVARGLEAAYPGTARAARGKER